MRVPSQRLPKVGEVWSAKESRVALTIDFVCSDYVAGEFKGKLASHPYAIPLHVLLTNYNPPEEPKKYYYVAEYEQGKGFDTDLFRFGFLVTSEEIARSNSTDPNYIRTIKLVEVSL